MSKPLRTGSFHLLLQALGGVLLLFILAPLISLLLHSNTDELAQTIADDEVRKSIGLTLWTSMAATAIMALGAIPLAYVLARGIFPFRSVVIALIEIPIVIPHSAAGIALFGFLNDRALAGQAAGWFGIRFIDTPWGIMAAMAFVSVPYLVSAAREGFEAVPERLEKAALNLGASRARVFRTVSLPLARRAILSGLVLMWGRGMSEFGAVMIIAYNPKITPVLLWHRFPWGMEFARPLALVFIGVCLVVFVSFRILAGSGGGHAAR